MDETRVCQYFERIGLTMPENIVPDAALLEKLTFHNIISIPYENTQFLTKRYVSCNAEDLFRRIILEKKGGISHDIAGLFGWFLTELGYDVMPVGTVSIREKLSSHIHKVLIVTDCEGTRWLTETGSIAMSARRNSFHGHTCSLVCSMRNPATDTPIETESACMKVLIWQRSFTNDTDRYPMYALHGVTLGRLPHFINQCLEAFDA